MSKNPIVALGINYQKVWEKATRDDIKKDKATKVTSLIYNEDDSINRRNYNDEDK